MPHFDYPPHHPAHHGMGPPQPPGAGVGYAGFGPPGPGGPPPPHQSGGPPPMGYSGGPPGGDHGQVTTTQVKFEVK